MSAKKPYKKRAYGGRPPLPRPEVIQPLNESYRYIALTQEKVAIVDLDEFDKLSRKSWCAGWNGRTESHYAVRGEFVSCGKRKIVKMHCEIMKPPKGMEVDHINRDTLDNRKSNLRICKKRQNLWNRKMDDRNKSGFRGVSWDKKGRGGWVARIRTGKKYAFLGRFADPIEAAKVFDAFALKDRGEFAQLNFPAAQG